MPEFPMTQNDGIGKSDFADQSQGLG